MNPEYSTLAAAVADMERENEKLRTALQRITALDYRRAAANLAAHTAFCIAFMALDTGLSR